MERNICATLDLIDRALDDALDGGSREEFIFERFDTSVDELDTAEFEQPMLV